MNICIVSPGKIPALLYGGTERVISWLVSVLTRMGHYVTLITPEDSFHPDAKRNIHFAHTGKEINRFPPELSSIIPEDADIVHIHFTYSGNLGKPTLKTVHGYPFHYTGRTEYALPEEFDDATSFVSDAHRKTCGRPHNPFIHNGLDPDEYIYRTKKKPYCLFLGKVDWNVKGLSAAISVAEKSGIALVIAGDFLDPGYYGRELRPRLSNKISYVGPVGGNDKAELLADAQALLFPSLWPEPFGLVAIEAMVSGTPVLGTLNGALPETIRHGKTGFLAAKPSETCEHLRLLDSIKSEDCRRHVLENFTSQKMAENYLHLYLSTLKNHFRTTRA